MLSLPFPTTSKVCPRTGNSIASSHPPPTWTVRLAFTAGGAGVLPFPEGFLQSNKSTYRPSGLSLFRLGHFYRNRVEYPSLAVAPLHRGQFPRSGFVPGVNPPGEERDRPPQCPRPPSRPFCVVERCFPPWFSEGPEKTESSPPPPEFLSNPPAVNSSGLVFWCDEFRIRVPVSFVAPF